MFTLGATYTRFVRQFMVRLPPIDPGHFIIRFAQMLAFGDETPQVARDALRLVSRYNTDWLQTGRRPSGICGACLLLAARMNNFRRSVTEVVQVVKIAECTLNKRLQEFKNTPSGDLSVHDFRNMWLEQENDPPAFTRGKEKRNHAEIENEGEADVSSDFCKRPRMEPTTTPTPEQPGSDCGDMPDDTNTACAPAVPFEIGDVPFGSESPNDVEFMVSETMEKTHEQLDNSYAGVKGVSLEEGEALADQVLAQLEVGEAFARELEDSRREETPNPDHDTPAQDTEWNDPDIDDEEIQMYIAGPDDVVRKEKVWVERNFDWMEATAGAHFQVCFKTNT